MTVRVHWLTQPETAVLTALTNRLDAKIQLSCGENLPPDAQIVVAGRPAADQLAAAPRLKSLVIPWAGIPAATRELLRHFPHITVHNLHHNAQPVAEMVMTLLMTAAKFIVPFDRALRQGDWHPRYRRPVPTLSLMEKTAVILGYGAIGQRVGRLCQALGMQVFATRRTATTVSTDAYGVTVYPADRLSDLLGQANALLLCLPLTPETQSIIGVDQLAMLPQPAVLVNVGRAQLVDEAALFAALSDGRLHAAGLDVWYHYPPDAAGRAHTAPASYPFHTLENVVMSPHRAGQTDQTERLRMSHLAQLLNAAADGRPLPNPVDLTRGY